MSESGVEAIVSDYFSRLKQALAPLPRSRRDQLLDDLHEHVTMAPADLADESELSVREILEHLGMPEEIATEALAGYGGTAAGGHQRPRLRPMPRLPEPGRTRLADIGPAAIVYGVIGYPGRAKISLYTSTAGTFDRGQPLPAPSVTVVHGVSFFIGTLPRSACDYPSLELNSAARQGSSQHNFGFGSCVTGKLVKITGSMGAWNVSG